MSQATTMTESERARELDKVMAEVFINSNGAFLGPLMASLEFVWTDSIPTCATDYERILWNPADFDKQTRKTRVASLVHELAHNYRLHGLRQGVRDNEVWNVACDIAINRELRRSGYDAPPPDFIPDMPQLKAELEEEIYELLQQPPKSGAGGGSQAQQGLPGGHCSCHMLPAPTKAQQQTLVNNVVQAMQQAKMSGNPGSIPGTLETLLNTFLKPQIPWEQHLYQWFSELLDSHLTYQRPNRRYQSHGILIKSRIPERNRLDHLVYAFDVSGSVSDEQVTRFNSEMKYIKDTFQPTKMTLILFDTKVQKVIEITQDDDFNELKVVGRGGTDLRDVRKFLKKSEATAAVIFSDLYCSPMEPGLDIPIIWVCIDNETAEVPFGKLLHIKVDTQ